MPAARISSGPSASKQVLAPAAISSAQAARFGRQHVRGRVDSVPAAVRPGRGHVRTLGRLGHGARSAEHEAFDLPAPPSRSSSGRSRRGRARCRRRSPGPARPRAARSPRGPRPRSFRRRRASSRRPWRRPSASVGVEVGLPSPTAPTRCAASRPSVWRRVTRPSSPFSSPTSTSRWATPRPAGRDPGRRLSAPRDRERRRRGRRPRSPQAAPRRRRSS